MIAMALLFNCIHYMARLYKLNKLNNNDVFFVFFKMFLVGLATVVRLCFTSDTVLLID